mgnify:CR=1 FL=1
MSERHTDMTVAKTILEQLGGNKFRVMTGAKNFGARDNSLSMRIGRNKTSSNYLKITLNMMDLYDVRFSRVTKMGSERSVTEYNNVYNDSLVEVFEKHTGMYTKLF